MRHIKPIIFTLILLFNLCSTFAQNEEEKVKETCNRFIQGRVKLRADDSLQLKSVTSDSLFKLLMLHHKYEKMLKSRIIRADLNMRVKSVDIDGDCASCQMTSMEYYKIHLCKDDDKNWRIKGENSMFPTEKRLTKARNKIKNYRIQKKYKPRTDSIIKAVNSFLPKVKDYFLTQNLEPLKTSCDEATVDLITTLYTYAKERTGLELLHKEMNQPNFMVGDYYRDNGLIEFKFYKEDITIVLTKNDENKFIISGFNGSASNTIDTATIKNEYLNLLRAMKLTRQARYRHKELD